MRHINFAEMDYFKNVKENQTLRKAFWEIPASFVFVILYFLLVTIFLNIREINSLGISALLFSAIWFIEVKIFSFKAKVHILPVFSFIESLADDDFTSFIYRIPGQFLGVAVAILVLLLDAGSDYTALYQIQFFPADAFLSTIFTGFIAQLIYFLYYILFYKTKLSDSLKLFFHSARLGVLFFMVSKIGNISLFNPFGILFSSLLNGHRIRLNTFMIGSTIHIIVPMFFIGGTHYFMNGFVFRKN